MNELVGQREMEVRMIGDDRVVAMLWQLPEKAQQRVLKPLMRVAVREIAAAEKDEAPRRSGLLRTALGASTLKTYKQHTLFVAAGVRRGFRRALRRTARGALRYRGTKATAQAASDPIADPAKYLHLVTGGRKAVSATNAKVLYSSAEDTFFGRQAAAVAPDPFIERAFGKVNQQVVSRLTAQAVDRITAEARGQ